MPQIVLPISQLLWVRVAALLFTCVAFSVQTRRALLPPGGMADWCIFCWVFSFTCTLLVLLVELFGLQAQVPVPWSNFRISIACYATHFCISASVIFPFFFLKDQWVISVFREVHDHRIASTVFSCLAAAAYMGEVILSKPRPGEVAGYMATALGLLKVCQTSVACVIFALVRNPVSYERHAALKWCMAVYCICFIVSMVVVVLCVGECTGYLPIPFLLAYGLLGFFMYFTATMIWSLFLFDRKYWYRFHDSKMITAAMLTALNLQ